MQPLDKPDYGKQAVVGPGGIKFGI